jgi:hypothetical protein
MVNNPLHIEKKQWACSLLNSDLSHLFCSRWLWALPLWRLLLCFWVITVNPTFVTHYDPSDKDWVLVSLLAYLKTRVYVLLLLIICQESGNKLCVNAVHIQIFC